MKSENKKHSWKLGFGLVALALVFGILVAVNVIASSMRLRIDLTQEKLYTLSPVTRQVLAGLDKTVTLKFFFNRSAPDIPTPLKGFADQVEDLLREYSLAARGRIIVEKYDPKPDSDAAELAQQYGLSSQRLWPGGPAMTLGLAAVAGEEPHAIPWLDPRNQSFLEYGITRLLVQSTRREKPTLGVMSSLPVLGREMPNFMMGADRSASLPRWALFKELENDYDLVEIAADTGEIPDSINTMVVAHPKNLDDKTIYALDQFVLRGGSLFAFLDSRSLADMQQTGGRFMPGVSFESDLNRLTSAWGINFESHKLVADQKARAIASGMPMSKLEESLVFLELGPERMNKDDVVTANLASMQLPYAGCFTGEPVEGLTLTTLLRSSPASQLVEAQAQPAKRIQPSGLEYRLAIRLHGVFPTAFPDGMPLAPSTNDAETAQSTQPALKKSEKPGTVVLVADADMLYDPFILWELPLEGGYSIYQLKNDNMRFFNNVLDQVAGGINLVGVRSRGRVDRPFTRVRSLQANAEQAYLPKLEQWEDKQRELERRIQELLRTQDRQQQFILNPEQKLAIERLQAEKRQVEKELRIIRRNLWEGIEDLGLALKAVNILVLPLLVGVLGLVFYAVRHGRGVGARLGGQ